MGFQKTTINISGVDKTLIVINHGEEKEKKKDELKLNQVHHIHILDRSGSMYPHINELIDNVQQTLTPSLEIMKTEYLDIVDKANKKKVSINALDLKLRKFLEENSSESKKELTSKRAELNTLKLAKILTGDFFPEMIPNKKGDYEYTKDNTTLVAKVARTKEYF